VRIAIVASNPSHLGPNSPAKKVFQRWMFTMGVDVPYVFLNVSNSVTPNNRPLKKSEYELVRLKNDLRFCSKFLALGNTASDALTRLHVSHFKLPHPSPKNRKLNDHSQVVKLLAECKVYLDYRF
jgi:hypothetical protein